MSKGCSRDMDVELMELFMMELDRRNEWTTCNKCTIYSKTRKRLHTSNTGELDKGKEEKDNTIHISNIQPTSQLPRPSKSV
jgi:hypothetical protein